ncbi:MAG: glutathione S-transferase family protein [Paracoccus sp. (in: a-proteobacteria)]|nr:glutathione S-transferase family protein [Paracoccus sp. (in: a-proteobacteria)]
MSLRLFHSPASPYVRKVMITAYERGIADRIEFLEAAAGPVRRDMNIVRHNASGKVPCLLIENDEPVFDSRVICQYLDQIAGTEGSVYGTGSHKIRILTLEALADSILDACLLRRYEDVLRPAEFRWSDWADSQMEKVDSGLDDLAGRWMPELTGPFHAGAIATAATLGYLDFRFPERDWRKGRPQLAQWFDEISRRESLILTAPRG